MPKNMASDATFASANGAERKNRMGSIGAAARASHTTNNATSSAPAASEPTISGLPQP